ncbi:MAG: hypothetical protein QOF26_3768, partial [Baekduia sp.]|nr:hypothetical protein [Baekduia sp.]
MSRGRVVAVRMLLVSIACLFAALAAT